MKGAADLKNVLDLPFIVEVLVNEEGDSRVVDEVLGHKAKVGVGWVVLDAFAVWEGGVFVD